jgi:hypothetical protein
MKILGITSTTILGLVLGIAGPAYAQQDQQGDKQDHPDRQQEKHEQAKPDAGHAQQHQRQDQSRQQEHAQQQGQDQNKQQEHARQQQQQDGNNQQEHARQQQSDRDRQQQQHAQQQPQHDQQQHAQAPRSNERPARSQEQQRVEQSAWQGHRAQSWQSDHRTWQQRGGYHGYRVPDDRYRGYFGPEHGFRIYGLPFLVVGGYPRFQYQGYWISTVDPWPEYWANDWYDTDDVYVTYADNGYYLYNRRYPGAGVAISISF